MIATQPQPGKPREYHFPRFERRVLGNGLAIIVAPSHAIPIVTVLAISDAGSVADPEGKEGVASLTARTLNEGTATLGGEELTEHMEQLGTSLGGSADWDSASLAMTVSRTHLEDALERFSEVLCAPVFPEPAVERLKGERIAEIMQVESEPRELADEKFDEYVYESGSRFRIPQGGTRESISSVTRDDVVAFHALRYRPAATTLIIVGDVTTSVAEEMVRRFLGKWKGGRTERVRANDTPSRAKKNVRIVKKTDAPQSELRIGHVGVSRMHPDYFSITVMNAVLGGLFSSRINLNLREEHGYTYGASSAYDWRREAGPFVIGTAVASNVTAAAIRETLKEVDKLRDEEIGKSELTLATSYLDGVFPIRYETTSSIAAALAILVIYDLPDDWYDEYRARIRAVTTKDVLNAAKNHLHPEAMQIMIVGDAESIRGSIAELDLGMVEVVGA